MAKSLEKRLKIERKFIESEMTTFPKFGFVATANNSGLISLQAARTLGLFIRAVSFGEFGIGGIKRYFLSYLPLAALSI